MGVISMKILFLSGNLCNGGAQRVISVVASQLAEQGNDVSLLLFSRNEKEYPISDKVNIVSISKNFQEYCSISFFSRLKFIRKYLKSSKPDVAIGFLEGGYGLYISSFGLKLKKVASARIDPTYLFKAKGLRAFLNKMWFCSADAIVLQTNSQLDHMPEKMRKQSVVIANPVSDDALTKPQIVHSEKCRKIVMAGRLARQKNYPMVFEAVKIVREKYPDIKLDIFGKGSQEAELQNLIDTNGLADNIELCGWSQNTLEEYRNHDMYILSSDFEGMPNALMEAMAVGLPCISTDCDTGPSDLIEHEKNGFLVPVGDSAMLADYIIKIIEMTPEQRLTLGNNAHSTMRERFNSDYISQKWGILFEDIVRRK